MIYHILNRQYESICIINSESKDSVIMNEDKHSFGISNSTLLNILDVTISKVHPDAAYIQAGTYIAFQDENGNNICLELTDVKDSNRYERVCHYEDLGMQLINESPNTFASSFSQPIEYYVNREIYDSGWELSLIHISEPTRP
mgnify:CR=1 FL=1